MSTIKSSAEDLTLNADGSGNDVIIQSNASTKAIVTAEGNVGIGVTPEAWHSNYQALQIGESGAFWSHKTNDDTFLTSNTYYDGAYKYIATDTAALYNLYAGTHTFKVAASDDADEEISWNTAMTIGNDGKISTWHGTGMTSHFNVGNRDIDVGTSTGYANRQERIGLMAADPWGTAAGIYLSISRNTNQDGRSHPTLHFTGNHGVGQSENHLIMSLASSFYDRETVTIGSGNNDADLSVHGDVKVNTGNLVICTAGKGIDFSANANSSAGGATTSDEVLNHYEEGTWTPIMNAIYGFSEGGSPSYSGKYTRIGNIVHATFVLDFDSSSLPAITDRWRFKGLPFAIDTGWTGHGTFVQPGSWSSNTNALGIASAHPSPTDEIFAHNTQVNGTPPSYASTWIYGSVSYMTT